MLKVSKYVKTIIVVSCMGIMLAVSVYATGLINSHSYNIEEIAVTEETSPPTEATEPTPSMSMSTRSIVAEDMESIQRGKMPDEEYAVMRTLSVLMNSPMSKSIQSASYEVKLVDNDWVTKFSSSEYDLYVSCEKEFFNPIIFTCSRKFTPEEKEFFGSLGSAWEIENEDGTYSIYFT